jgi:hypothetical protein
MREVMDDFMRIMAEVAVRKPAAKFVVPEPITRPKVSWYQNFYEDILTAFTQSLARKRKNKITQFEAIPHGC